MHQIDINHALQEWLASWQRAGFVDWPNPGVLSPKLIAQLQQLGVSSPATTATPTPAAPTTAPRPAALPSTLPTPARPANTPVVSRPVATLLPLSKPEPDMPRRTTAKPVTTTAATSESLLKSAPLPAAERWPALNVIKSEVEHCVRCEQLASARQHTVFGVGDPNAKLCFVGEAPGADEDEQGEPFVGRAGQLLTKIIEACKLQRSDVWICNVLKCRPPNNRPPEPTEVINCRGYLDRQLAIVRPEVIVCLGATAAKCLLNTEVSIGKLRGKWHDYRGLQVYCTYHPAYLLRNPNAKKDVWEDMKVVMRRLGVELS
jgi:uracil-DNA glycosylase